MAETTSEHLLALMLARNELRILHDGACQLEHLAHARVRLVHQLGCSLSNAAYQMDILSALGTYSELAQHEAAWGSSFLCE